MYDGLQVPIVITLRGSLWFPVLLGPLEKASSKLYRLDLEVKGNEREYQALPIENKVSIP